MQPHRHAPPTVIDVPPGPLSCLGSTRVHTDRRPSTPTCLRLGVATALTIAAARPAEATEPASERGPDIEVRAIRGRVARASAVELDSATRFVLLELVDARPGTGTPPSEPWVHLVAGELPDCERYFGMVVVPDADVRGFAERTVGAELDGVLVYGRPGPQRRPWCELADGFGDLGPGISPYASNHAAWSQIAARRQTELLPALDVVRDFFDPNAELVRVSLPLDLEIEQSLRAIDSLDAYAFVLRHRMYFFADFSHAIWRADPANFTMVERELLERPWLVQAPSPDPLPDISLVHLFWMTSPSRARATITRLIERDPDRALAILAAAPPRDDVHDLLIELGERDGGRQRQHVLRTLAYAGTEHDLERMRAALASAEDAQGLATRIAELDRRRAMGIRDGVTLGAYLWASRDEAIGHDTPLWNTRVELVVPGERSCRGSTELGGGVVLELEADCDAESLAAVQALPTGAPITVVGFYDSAFVSDSGRKLVRLRLVHASATPGGVVLAPEQPTAEPRAPRPSGAARGGCGCTTSVPGAASGLLGLVLVARRRRTRLRPT